jgi:hypothetical protein
MAGAPVWLSKGKGEGGVQSGQAADVWSCGGRGDPSDSQDLTAVGVGYARREQGKDGALTGGPRLQYPGSN